MGEPERGRRGFLELYPVQPSNSEALETYLEQHELTYRIPLLLSTGSIYVERGSSGQIQRNGKSPVGRGDWVARLAPVPPAYERALGQIPAADFRDYVWLTLNNLYVNRMIELRADTARKNTDIINMSAAIFDLATYIQRVKRPRKYSPLVTHAIRDLVIYAHAWGTGWMDVLADDGQAKGVFYETLEVALKDPKQRPSYTLSADLFDPRPKNRDGTPGRGPALHIRGCRLGKALPFLQLLKKLLGDAVTVTAPKYWVKVNFLRGRTPGYFEYLAYSFNMLRPERFRGPVDHERAAKEIASQRHNIRIDGSPIRASDISGFIPKDPNKNRPSTSSFTVPFDSGSFELPVEYRHVADMGFKITGIRTTEDLSDSEKLPAILTKILPTADPRFLTGHPFPQWARYELRSLEELVSSFNWEAEKTGTKWTVRAFTNWYEVEIPLSIGNRVPGNFFPSSPTGDILLGLDEFDTDFYAVV